MEVNQFRVNEYSEIEWE
ncbi:hypothetical protein Goari_021722 [Gossypium aridum]|uniref:Uncharacterized protein n=1 Tax=Gossypium aridum TaxID=34290 RepID=A0A7J8YF84_GOSAI|nr:hypothetical protein [Gossypium aridum]